jgi:hypothetical protein
MTTFDRLLVDLLDIRAERPRTSPPQDAHKSGQNRASEAHFRASVLLRDEEAVGSNPATPTNKSGPCNSNSGAARGVYSTRSTAVASSQTTMRGDVI